VQRHRLARHHAARHNQGPSQEQTIEEIFPPGHKFTPEEKAEASAVGVFVDNGMWKDAFKYTNHALKAHPERWWLQAARAAAASNLNRPKDTIEAVDEALRTNNGDANKLNLYQLYTLKANALSLLNRKSEALNLLLTASKLSQHDPFSRAGAAWLYATAADPQIRNGAEAVRLATEATKLSREKDATILDVLAAAYAEQGDFKSAQKWEAKAILRGDSQDIPYYQQRMQAFQAGRPWRETAR
jgi:tetratricopeptide (TPR) repeat protein